MGRKSKVIGITEKAGDTFESNDVSKDLYMFALFL